MKKISSRKRWLAAMLLLAALLGAAFIWEAPLLRIGAGYAAKQACSCHFLQGRSLADIRANDLNFSVLGQTRLVVHEQTVGASFYGFFSREARYRPGVGCTLINDAQQPLVEVKERAGHAGAGVSRPAQDRPPAALRAAIDHAMAPRPGGGTRGLVVLKNGELLAEAYAPGFDQHTLLPGWSMTKTLTALALGPALARRASPGQQPNTAPARRRPAFSPAMLTEHPPLFPEIWTDTARQQITLEDLLRMQSGLAWNEAYGGLSDATIMLHEHADMFRYAVHAPAVAPPAKVWNYSSGTTNLLMQFIDRQYPEKGAYGHVHELLKKVAPSLLLEPDQAGLPVGSSYGWATARDWARLGQFMLQDGIWEGDTLLPPGWIDWLRQPAPTTAGHYGGQLWLPTEALPDLPADAFMLRGFQDQRVFVLPAEGLVIARLAHQDDKTTDFNTLVREILQGAQALAPLPLSD